MSKTNDVLKLLDRIKLWQLTFILSAAALIAGFTGELHGYKVLDGREDMAIYVGIGGIILSVILRTFPPRAP